MRGYAQRLMDFWDDLGIWTQYGISYVAGILGFLLLLESLTALYDG